MCDSLINCHFGNKQYFAQGQKPRKLGQTEISKYANKSN